MHVHCWLAIRVGAKPAYALCVGRGGCLAVRLLD